MYQSEFTKFMNDYLQQHPEVEAERQQLRLTFWDRKVDREDQRRWHESNVPQQPYVYQSE